MRDSIAESIESLNSTRLTVSVGHEDLSWSPEKIVGGASNFIVATVLGCMLAVIVHRFVAQVVAWCGWPLSEQEPLMETKKATSKGNLLNTFWSAQKVSQAVQMGSAFLLFGIAGMEASIRQAPENAAYPNLYATLRCTHAFASLGYAWLLLLCWTLRDIPTTQRYVQTLRPLILLLWVAWVAIFPLLCLSLHSTPYAGFWVTDCSEADVANSTRLTDSQSKLQQFATKLQAPVTSSGVLDQPWLCVAVVTTPRKPRYLTMSVGALLGGLSREELSQVRVKVVSSVALEESNELEAFVGSDGLRLHPLLEVVGGDAESSATTDSDWHIKENQNYLAGLNACSHEGLPYVLVLEDDAISTDAAVHKVASAIKAADASSNGQWRVLKLFVTEYWRGHWTVDFGSLMCLLVWPGIFGILFGTCLTLLWRPKTGRFLVFLLAVLFATSATSFAAWAVGRANLQQLFPQSASRHTPPDALCPSTVANLYPLSVVEELSEWIKTDMNKATDLAVCNFAVNAPGPGDHAQWLYTPSLFQHVGRFSSNQVKNQGSCVHSKFAMTWRPQ